jgi:hypothetical protein
MKDRMLGANYRSSEMNKLVSRVEVVYFNLENCEGSHDVPSWAYVREDGLLMLYPNDRKFLMEGGESDVAQDKAIVAAHAEEQSSWLVVGTASRRIKYIVSEGNLSILFQEREKDKWNVTERHDGESFIGFEKAILLAESTIVE